jgi:YidC/Oxa1 family membrane protein insertase
VSVLTQFVTYFADGLRSLANFFSFLGDQKWAAAIVALTIIIRTLLLPLAIKQIKSMREQQRLNPEVQRLKQKYKSDRQTMNQEMMALYQREGVNPMAACLPLIVQMPILIAINGAIRRLTAIPLLTLKEIASYASTHHLSLVKAAAKLHVKAPQDKLEAIGSYAARHHTSVLHAAQRLHIVEKMPFLMFGDLSNPASKSLGGWLLIILMTIVSLLSAIQINVGGTQQQRQMQLLTPLLFTVFFIRFPTALLLYWTTQQLYQFVQQSIMTRDMRRESGGWLAMLPWKSSSKTKSSGKAKREPQRSQERVRPTPAVATAGAPTSMQNLQARRDLEDKRRRRRNNKKKKKRRK